MVRFDLLDVNECLNGFAKCSQDSNCVNLPGSYICQCTLGFTGQFCDIGLKIQIK